MTTQQFKTNLNCGKCVAAVKPYLDGDESIERWEVETDREDKRLTVVGDGVTRDAVSEHLNKAGFKVLDGDENSSAEATSDDRSFLEAYRPLLLVLVYLIGVVAITEFMADSFDMWRAMRNFMGGFFVAFSFFKLLDLEGFVDSFQTYDVVARPFRPYGYAYPFIELLLGIAYLTNFAPVVTNAVTLAVMLIGLIGVSMAVFRKQQIQCACLGTVFNLPMSQVTIIEDGAMAAMAATMLFELLG